MTLASETVALPGSGLVFVNTYTAAVTDAYRNAILTAENFFQSHFIDSVTVNMVFDLTPLTAGFVAQNEFGSGLVSYGVFTAALAAHATTADDALAVAGLPVADPSHGVGISLPLAEAHLLGLSSAGALADDTVRLNSNLHWTFGQDAVSALEHEISEGVFGRVGSLGITSTAYSPMDLFRFTLSGVHDFTGGLDGQTTVFGVDGAHLTSLVFHNSISTSGAFDGFDLADWNGAGDAFGLTNLAAPGAVSATDLRVLDILGWTPAGAPTPTAGNDSLVATPTFPEIHAGAGDDTIAGTTVADYLRGDDGDDSISGGPAFDDINGNMGNDTCHGNGGDDWVVGGKNDDMLFGDAGDDVVWGNLGNDTLDGGTGNDQVRGGQGDDILFGGSGNDYISGDRGNDTETGGAGADLFHSFSGAGSDRVLDFHISEGDRVMLDPGTAFTVSQVGADTVVDMGNGDQVILVGVSMSTLTPGWIFLG